MLAKGGDAGGSQAVLGHGLDMALQAGKHGVEPVAAPGFDQADESFNRTEFGAVEKQGKQPEIGRQSGIVARQVEAGLIR